MITAGEAHITQNTLFVGMALLCGFTFPPALLPDVLQLARRGAAGHLGAACDARRRRSTTAPLVGGAARICCSASALGSAYLLIGLRLLGPAERVAVQRGGAA